MKSPPGEKIWKRSLPESATQMFPLGSMASEVGKSKPESPPGTCQATSNGPATGVDGAAIDGPSCPRLRKPGVPGRRSERQSPASRIATAAKANDAEASDQRR